MTDTHWSTFKGTFGSILESMGSFGPARTDAPSGLLDNVQTPSANKSFLISGFSPAIPAFKRKEHRDGTVYLLLLAKITEADEVEHQLLLETRDEREALSRKREVNRGKPFFGSKELAHITRREARNRKWKLWRQDGDQGEIHLLCDITRARGVLCRPNAEDMKVLREGRHLASAPSVKLMSEQVAVRLNAATETSCIKSQSLADAENHPKTNICLLDINSRHELTCNPGAGVTSRHPIENDTTTLPPFLARILWNGGVAIPLELIERQKIKVRITDNELRARLRILKLNCEATVTTA